MGGTQDSETFLVVELAYELLTNDVDSICHLLGLFYTTLKVMPQKRPSGISVSRQNVTIEAIRA